ncbi:transglycosylase SLT domain-containing protein [Aliivibrio fischeri]|uniref:transglycosylase SLT domain-containing protein n=1 Tax=Aliivibrio fischeri TaxID=668 RepID=UPI001F3122C6|nr:transglycosylase SLT domain-containing protein [Aliivibrio fischeri]MCE4936381.1 transglycosylase SLT domain-containing protein [Aliivibrio fischeri]
MKYTQYKLGMMTALCIGMNVQVVDASPVDIWRAQYQEAKTLLNEKKYDEYKKVRAELDGYSLAPYLDYRELRMDLSSKTPDDIRLFKHNHKSLPIGNSLSYQYLVILGLNERWAEFIDYFPNEPSSKNLQCYYYQAKNKLGDKVTAWKGAEQLWLTGSSVTYECDDLFQDWAEAEKLSDDLIIERMLLVYKARNNNLFSYLEKMLKTDAAKEKAQHIVTLFNDPDLLESFSKSNKKTEFSKQLTLISMEREARKNPKKAIEILPEIAKKQQFTQEELVQVKRRIVSSIMSTESAELAQWRDKELATNPEDSFIERRIRVAIRAADWDDVSNWIGYLTPTAKNSLRWQFWIAQIESKEGEQDKADARLKRLLGQRNFYSVAAANILGEPIQYPMNTAPRNIKPIKDKYSVELARIKELIAIDEIPTAKSEWEYLLNRASKTEVKELASYAAQHRWHHFTVLATIKGRMWGYLSLRFPIAHQWWFNHYSKELGLDKVTLMSLSRQESALYAEAQSPVGARGLMQIMPATAKYTAKKIDYNKYEGVDSLNDVDVNIHIGSNYLKGLLDDYDGNRIFALAGYNAGPHRVKRWRAVSDEKLDAYAFIEAIPFKETRGYVQNILMFETYYRSLLGEKGAFLSEKELNLKY